MKGKLVGLLIVSTMAIVGLSVYSFRTNDSFLQGKVAPLLPEEFSANVIQNKFN